MVVIEAYFHGMPFCPFGIPASDIFMTAHSTAVIQIKVIFFIVWHFAHLWFLILTYLWQLILLLWCRSRINSVSSCGTCGLMDKASDFRSEDCRLESCHGRDRSIFSWYAILAIWDTCFWHIYDSSFYCYNPDQGKTFHGMPFCSFVIPAKCIPSKMLRST